MRAALLYLAGLLTAAGGLHGGVGDVVPSHATALSARTPNQPVVSEGDPFNILRAADGLFYVQAGVASQNLRLLVDTGATHVVLSHKDAKRIANRPLRAETSKIKTAGGTVVVDWVVIDQLTIAGMTVRSVRAAVPRHDIEISLLGQNALVQFSKLEIEGDRMILQR